MKKPDKKKQKPDWFGRESVNGITIDGEYSRDLDDAIWVEKNDNQWLVHVSITDLSVMVKQNSDIDHTAMEKCFTRYYRNYNEPMIPRWLSEKKASLWEGKERPVITISIPISSQFEIGDPTIRRMKLKSFKKLSYETVDSILTQNDHELHELLMECHKISQVLLNNRREKGALAIYDINTGWATTEEGLLIKIRPEKAHYANIIIQEFMILANSAIATYMAEHGFPMLYRNHTTKKIAPNRATLISELNDIIISPGSFNINNLQKRINLVLNRANYGPILEGHFGLNLPAYTHFTSPIRRFADLINHRLFIALLNGEEAPYTIEELKKISAHINKIEKTMKEKTKEYLKNRALAQTAVAIQNDTLSGLNTKEFHQALKMSLKEDTVTEAIEHETLKRIKNNGLPIQDIVFILFSSLKNDQVTNLQKSAFESLKESPEKAIQVFHMAHQEYGIKKPNFHTVTEGLDHSKIFSTTSEIKIDEKLYVSHPCSSSSRKQAEQFSAVMLIGNMIGCEITISENNKKQPETSTTQGEIMENYKGQLMELCQKNRWSQPEFSVEKKGEDHAPEFHCIAEIKIEGKKYTSESVIANNKKEAERLASFSLLKKIPIFKPEKTDTEITIEDYGDNFISALNEVCQKKAFSMPEYSSIRKSGPDHQPIISIDCQIDIKGETITKTGTGVNKKVAKQAAAQNVLRQILKV